MASAEELEAELARTRLKLGELTAEVARNEQKLRRTQKREARLLQAESLDALFRELIDGLRDGYRLEYVSVVICDPGHDIRHLLQANSGQPGAPETLLFVEALTGLAPQYVALRRPWLGAYAPCDHQLIMPRAERVRSVAIIPLRHDRKLIGSINFGSADEGRFTGEHAADFLAHLGVIASYCLENVVNRASLLRSGFTDVLTGWHNRRYLHVRLKEELARARRDGSRLVCLMLDVDHFKRVNDNWGHAAGDAVLREIAQRIDSQVRASDVAARYGGEEFVVLLPDTDTASGVRLAERIRGAVAATPYSLPSGDRLEMTASIGISSIVPAPDARDLKTLGEALIAQADVALYRAKSGGRNQVVVGEADR